MIDLHCHLLPGLDDGPRNLEESLQLAQGLSNLGFTTVVATPHNPWGTSTWTQALVEEHRQVFAAALVKAGIQLAVCAGAEHHSSGVAELAQRRALVCYPRDDSFLMEFPLNGFPARLEDLLFLLQVKGKVPAIAHVERYPEVHKSLKAVNPLKDRGCYLLVNLSSLSGMRDHDVQATARALVKTGLADAATTDLHDAAEAQASAAGLRVLRDLAGPEGVERLLVSGPARIAGLERAAASGRAR